MLNVTQVQITDDATKVGQCLVYNFTQSSHNQKKSKPKPTLTTTMTIQDTLVNTIPTKKPRHMKPAPSSTQHGPPTSAHATTTTKDTLPVRRQTLDTKQPLLTTVKNVKVEEKRSSVEEDRKEENAESDNEYHISSDESEKENNGRNLSHNFSVSTDGLPTKQAPVGKRTSKWDVMLASNATPQQPQPPSRKPAVPRLAKHKIEHLPQPPPQGKVRSALTCTRKISFQE